MSIFTKVWGRTHARPVVKVTTGVNNYIYTEIFKNARLTLRRNEQYSNPPRDIERIYVFTASKIVDTEKCNFSSSNHDKMVANSMRTLRSVPIFELLLNFIRLISGI